MARLHEVLTDVPRCPHCNVAHPTLARVWHSQHRIGRGTPGPTQMWAAYRCTACGSVVLARGANDDNAGDSLVTAVFPAAKTAHEDIPEPARKFLQQAYETLYAPDAAAVMAGSAVDAMLKHIGYKDGSLYTRIDTAVADHKITGNMGDWAHEVRLGSNRPRHADADQPHVTEAQAKQSVDFAEALAFFLFVLTKRIERGTAAAKGAT
jgi:hypothetical protein